MLEKHTPAPAVVLDCSDHVFVDEQRQILDDIDKAMKAGDVAAVRAHCDKLEELLHKQPTREPVTVTLAGDDIDNYHAIHAEGFEHKKTAVQAAARAALAKTADDVLAAIETGTTVPNKITTHRAYLRVLAAAAAAAKTHKELDALEIPD